MITSEIIHANNMDEFGTIISYRIIDILSKAIEKHDKCFLAVSGGRTPLHLYKKLINSKHQNALDWSKVHLFFIDERCVLKNDKENNFKVCYDSWLYQYPDIKYYRIKGWHNAKSAASEYENKIKSIFNLKKNIPRFDLIFMGIGEDGHIASLFPEYEFRNKGNQLVKKIYLKSKNIERISMTLPLLNAAKNRIFGIIGEKKKKIIRDLINSNYKDYPVAQLLCAKSQDIWVLN